MVFSTMFRFVKDKLGPAVYSEEQFIFLCHLVAPFLSRYNLDKPSPSILDIIIELFNALERMDKHVKTLHFMDPICDLLYPFLKFNPENTVLGCVLFTNLYHN